MCRYHRVVASWRPTNKASREHVHGSTFDVRSLILNLFGEGLDKESAVLTLVRRDILNGNRLDCVSLFPV